MEVGVQLRALTSLPSSKEARRNNRTSRMASYGMLRRLAIVRTEVSEEFRAYFVKVTRIRELGTTLAVTSKKVGSSKSRTA
jgi:hypothetical protein